LKRFFASEYSLVQATGVLTTEMGSEKVIMHPVSGEIWWLNRTASAIWACFAVPASPREAVSTLLDRFEIDAETCRSEVGEVCDRAIAGGFLVPVGDPA
tara:strand:- start:121 stop:417 length:297 start_codon:yes stop_codon:yes gene_type:complete